MQLSATDTSAEPLCTERHPYCTAGCQHPRGTQQEPRNQGAVWAPRPGHVTEQEEPRTRWRQVHVASERILPGSS